MAETPEEIEQRLERGDWLRPGDVAILLRTSRSTVIRMLKSGTIGFRRIPGSGRHRECDPVDVRAQLVERWAVRRGGAEPPAEPEP